MPGRMSVEEIEKWIKDTYRRPHYLLNYGQQKEAKQIIRQLLEERSRLERGYQKMLKNLQARTQRDIGGNILNTWAVGELPDWEIRQYLNMTCGDCGVVLPCKENEHRDGCSAIDAAKKGEEL